MGHCVPERAKTDSRPNLEKSSSHGLCTGGQFSSSFAKILRSSGSSSISQCTHAQEPTQ
jgi:hypothetical protein